MLGGKYNCWGEGAMEIAGYRVLEELHLGSRSTVYRAEPVEGGDTVVLKCFTATDVTAYELARFRYAHEMRATLDHDHIPSAIDLVHAHGRPIMVMEDIGGAIDKLGRPLGTSAKDGERLDRK